ncbi:MAG: hypothetical protein O7B99_08740, partial [Planctomycetota bacterium]|nr:hypothetical protein [Planctomycetota bacterium]
MIAALLVLAVALPGAQGENRLWLADLELEGPFESVVLDCGGDGRAVLVGPLLAGERRTLAVPLPVRSPLGASTLASVPAPAIEVRPPGAGTATFVGWSEEQPARRFETVAPALRGRPRPPVEGVAAGPRRASIAALLVVAGAFVLGLTWRARLVLVAAVGVAAAAGVLLLESRPGSDGRPITIVEGEAGAPTWLRVRGAAVATGDLGSGGTIRLESVPVGAALEVEVDLARSTWTARGAIALAQETGV